VQLEARLRNLEGKELGRFAGSAKGKPKIEAYDKDRKKGAGGLITLAKVYYYLHLVLFKFLLVLLCAD
jgi:nucleolar protein 58